MTCVFSLLEFDTSGRLPSSSHWGGRVCKMGKGKGEQEGAANGYRLDGFLALHWGLAPCAAHRPRSQSAEFARPHIGRLASPAEAVPLPSH